MKTKKSPVDRKEIRMRDQIQRRKQQANLTEMLKAGRPPRTVSRPKGESVTMTFSGTREVDEIIDYWAKEWNVGRSHVFRQAILLSDLKWRREHGDIDDQGSKVGSERSS